MISELMVLKHGVIRRERTSEKTVIKKDYESLPMDVIGMSFGTDEKIMTSHTGTHQSRGFTRSFLRFFFSFLNAC